MKDTMIAMLTYNREFITSYCISDLCSVKKDIPLYIFDDGSDYDVDKFKDVATVIKGEHVGVYQNRIRALNCFISSEYEYLYFTDNDVLFDEDFYWQIQIAKQDRFITGFYKTKWHPHRKPHNDHFSMIKSIPGISMLMNRRQAIEAVEYLEANSCQGLSWDWVISYTFDYFKVTNHSYVEHIGYEGLHTGTEVQDRALDARDNLIEKVRIFEKLWESESKLKGEHERVVS